MKKLIIVESPNKIKKIKSFLTDTDQEQYEVISSIGHIRELSTSGKFGLGLDLEQMTPKYKITKDKKDVIAQINDASKQADVIYLATDPDREGESIAWHIIEVIDGHEQKHFERIIFNEITKDAVVDSLEHPTSLNQALINSQEARRILDRMIGFRLSFLTKKKIAAKSSGRVKSSVLKIIIDREREIEAFVPQTWFNLEVHHSKQNILKYVDAKLKEVKVDSKEELEKIIKQLDPKKFTLVDTKKTLKTIKPPEPLEMATLLIKAYAQLGFSNAMTTSVAQKLYEKGFISYPRTDSKRISSTTFLSQAQAFIQDKTDSKFNSLKFTKAKNDQDAHEAIRPVEVLEPNALSTKLDARELKLYDLIWRLTLQTFMDAAKQETTTYIYENNGFLFTISATRIKTEGFKQLDLKSEKVLWDGPKTFGVKPSDIKAVKHETKPPARYNQATLIKKMKEEGIGRPSTYSATTSGLIKYNYVNNEKGVLIPTQMGKEVTALLQQSFSDIISEKYTSFLEEELDKISLGELNHKEFLIDFWEKFSPRIQIADETIEKKMPEFVGRKCPLDGGELVYKTSRYGTKFIACLNFPTCRYSESIEKKEIEYVGEKCPECGKELVYRYTKRNNKKFIACSGFPKCKYIRDIEPKTKPTKKENKKAE